MPTGLPPIPSEVVLPLAGYGALGGIGAAVVLGTRYELVERQVGYLDHALVMTVAGGPAWSVVRQVRPRRSTLES